MVLALLDGHHALYKVGKRLEERSVEYREGRGAQAVRRFVVVPASPLAQQQAQSYTAAPAQEAEAVVAHLQHGQARWFACKAEAAAALAEYAHRGPGRRGRRSPAWRYQAIRYRVVADPRRPRRARQGRPAKLEPPPIESGYRLMAEVETLANADEDYGWLGLTTPVDAEVCPDTDIFQAYQDQKTTVEPGLRWIKNPAAIAPVWLEKPERIAALARLTVLGLLGYSVSQRQGRLSLLTHDQQLSGNKGMTATPTAAVVLALFTQVALVYVWINEQEVAQLSGAMPHEVRARRKS